MPEDDGNRFNLPEPPSEAEIQRRLKHETTEPELDSRLPDPPEWNYRRKNSGPKEKAGSMAGIAFGVSMAYSLIAPILAGYGIGWWIDRRTGGEMGKTYGTVIGLIGGFVAMIVMAVTFNRRNPN